MLKRGQRFTIGQQQWRVKYVNASRAYCVAEMKRSITVTGKDGQPHTFLRASTRGINISPDTPVDLLTELIREISNV